MKRTKTQPFLLIPLLLIFVFSWTQASETVLCVSDSQTHYVKRNPLRMMACHDSGGETSHPSGHAETRSLHPGASACTEIILASANSIRQPDDQQFKTTPVSLPSWPATDITVSAPSVHAAEYASLQNTLHSPALRALRTTVLLI
ncbi:MAG TPA: hypothetical protein ENN06_12505 [Desulfobacteraceae bacterium]|nr:hypothetical protein [Desulfobacteraceae bacterium]